MRLDENFKCGNCLGDNSVQALTNQMQNLKADDKTPAEGCMDVVTYTTTIEQCKRFCNGSMSCKIRNVENACIITDCTVNV